VTHAYYGDFSDTSCQKRPNDHLLLFGGFFFFGVPGSGGGASEIDPSVPGGASAEGNLGKKILGRKQRQKEEPAKTQSRSDPPKGEGVEEANNPYRMKIGDYSFSKKNGQTENFKWGGTTAKKAMGVSNPSDDRPPCLGTKNAREKQMPREKNQKGGLRRKANQGTWGGGR